MEGFAATRNKTYVTAEELEGKELWLIRLPKDVPIEQLDGHQLKLSGHDTVVATLETESDRLIARKADPVERDAFHVLLADDDAPLHLGPRFHGMISVHKVPRQDTAEAKTVERVVPYTHIPQRPGLTVRFMPAGSTTSLQELQRNLAQRNAHAGTGPTTKKKKEKKHQKPTEEPDEEEAMEVVATKDKKKKKRKSTDKEVPDSTSVEATPKKKKEKKSSHS